VWWCVNREREREEKDLEHESGPRILRAALFILFFSLVAL
jgi:hypothetical protein